MNLTNQLLIATPDMQDERFHRAVILVCEHNEHGALGINLNLPSDISFDEILESLSIPTDHSDNDAIVYEGGPVNTQCGFILHQSRHEYDSSIQISKSMFLTTSKDIIKAIAQDTMDAEWIMALGCATWHEGQLEQEVADNTWLTCASDEHLIFNTQLDPKDKWELALKIIGVMPHQLSGDVGHA